MTLVKAANCTENNFNVDLHESDIKEKELFSVEDHTRYCRYPRIHLDQQLLA